MILYEADLLDLAIYVSTLIFIFCSRMNTGGKMFPIICLSVFPTLSDFFKHE